MRLIILILLLSTFLNRASAQDWHPVRVGEIYHYTKGTLQNTDSISLDSIFPLLPANSTFLNPVNWYGQKVSDYNDILSLRIDSSSYQNGDTVFYYSRHFIKCDTCSSLAIETVSLKDSIYYYPQAIKTANGSFNLIIETDTIKLSTYPPSTSFLDTIQALSFIADSSYIDSTHGDSVIVISVYTIPSSIKKYEMHLSKTYGIRQLLKNDINTLYSVFELMGIEIQNSLTGLTRLSYAETYNFNIGDEFYYKIHEFNGQGMWWCGHIYYQQKIRVSNKQIISADSVIYTFEQTNYQTPAQCPMPWPSNTNLINVLYGSEFHTEFIQGELTYYSPIGHLGCKDLLLSKMKYIGYDFSVSSNPLPPNYYISYFSPSSNNQNIYNAYGHPLSGFSVLFEQGLGKVFEGYWAFESTFEKQLVGYIKAGDTVGVIPYPEYLSVKKMNILDSNYQIVFNSTDQILNVTTSNLSSQQASLSLHSLDGKKVLEEQITIVKGEHYEIRIPSLQGGLYIATLYDKSRVLANLKISIYQ